MEYISLVNNITLLVALSVILDLVARKIKDRSIKYQILIGILFGITAIIGMKIPVKYSPGIIFDGRSIILGVAGFFGGPLVGAISTLMSIVFRVSLGGDGVYMGILVSLFSGASGSLYFKLRQKDNKYNSARRIYSFGLIIHLLMLISATALPNPAMTNFYGKLALPIIILFPIATLIICLIFLKQEEKHKIELDLKLQEKNYRDLVENSEGLIIKISPSGRITFLNNYASSFLGISNSEALDHSIVGSIFPGIFEDKAGQRQQIEQIFANPDQYSKTDINCYGARGSRIWIAWTFKGIYADDGSLVEIFCVGIDISEKKKNSEELLKTKEMLRGVIDAIPDWIYVKDKTGGYLLANKSYASAFGYEPSEMIGNKFDSDDFFLRQNTSDNSTTIEEDELIFSGSGIVNYDDAAVTVSGEALMFDVYKAPLFDSNEKVFAGLFYGRNITERKASEEALKKSELNFKELFNNINDAIIVHNVEGIIQELNEKAIRLFNIDRETALGLNITSFISNINISSLDLIGLWNNALNGYSSGVEFTAQKYNTSVNFDVKATINRTNWFDNSSIICTIADVTEINKNKSALLESENKYKSLHDSMMDAFIVSDLSGHIQESNSVFSKMIGYTRNELTNLNFRDITPSKWREFERKIFEEQVFTRGYSDVFEKEYVKKSGEIIPVEICAFLINNHAGESTGVGAIARDISFRKKIEAELKHETSLLNSFIDNNPFAIQICDKDGYVIRVNQAHTQLFGSLPPKNYSIFNDSILIGNDLKNEIQNIKKGQIVKVFNLAYNPNKIDSKLTSVELFINIVFFPILNEYRETHQIAILIEDVTDKHLAQQELLLKQQELDNFFNVTIDLLCIADTEGNFRRVNPEWSKALGYEISELENSKFIDFIHPDDLEGTFKMMELLADGQEVVCFENRYRTKSGTYKWIEWRSRAFNDVIYASARDVNDRKLFEQVILANEEKYVSIVEEIPHAIFRIDKETNFIFANRAYSDLIGVPIEDIIGKTTREMYKGENVEKFHADDEWVMNTDSKYTSIEDIYDDINNETNYVEIIKTPLHDFEGNVIGLQVILWKITELVKLKDNLELSQYSIENADDIFFRLDHNANIILANVAATNALGYSPNEFFGMSIYDIDIVKMIENNDTLIAQIRRDMSISFESIYKCKSGELLPVEIHCNMLNFKEKEYLFVSARDISSRKKSELALRESETTALAMLNASSDAAMLANINGDIITMNNFMKDRLNEFNPNVEIHTIFDVIDNKNIKSEKTIFINSIIINREPIEFETIFDNKWFENRIYPIFDENNEVNKLAVFIRDITARKQTEEIIRSSEEKFRFLYESMNQGVLFFNDRAKLISSNRAAREILDIDTDELENSTTSFLEIYTETGELIKTADAPIFKIIKSGKPIESRIYGLKNINKGNFKWIIATFTPQISEDNSLPKRYYALITDITERVQAQDQIKQMNLELESQVALRTVELETALEDLKSANLEVAKALQIEKELNDMKTRFISMVSHEYRTPLTVILSSTYLLDEYYRNKEDILYKNQIQRIQFSVDSMKRLLEDVLFIGKATSGANSIQNVELDIIDYARTIIDELKYFESGEHNILLNTNTDSLIINTDKNYIYYILNNLISNAIKYSPQGSEIRVDILNFADKCLVRISDKGIGIPVEERKYIFEAFHRFSNVGAISGTGLGLSIVKRCVDLLNATIEVESEENKGTTFKIVFLK